MGHHPGGGAIAVDNSPSRQQSGAADPKPRSWKQATRTASGVYRERPGGRCDVTGRSRQRVGLGVGSGGSQERVKCLRHTANAAALKGNASQKRHGV